MLLYFGVKWSIEIFVEKIPLISFPKKPIKEANNSNELFFHTAKED